jgi:hypothetical protein
MLKDMRKAPKNLEMRDLNSQKFECESNKKPSPP